MYFLVTSINRKRIWEDLGRVIEGSFMNQITSENFSCDCWCLTQILLKFLWWIKLLQLHKFMYMPSCKFAFKEQCFFPALLSPSFNLMCKSTVQKRSIFFYVHAYNDVVPASGLLVIEGRYLNHLAPKKLLCQFEVGINHKTRPVL